MTYKYKILSADPQKGTFVIQFEGKPPLNFWIPHNDSEFLTGDALEEAIQNLHPQNDELTSNMSNLANSEEILKLVDSSAQSNNNSENSARQFRNSVLKSSDWTQLIDAPLTAEQKNAWAVYRQGLRDVTTQVGFPDIINWPTSPVPKEATKVETLP